MAKKLEPTARSLSLKLKLTGSTLMKRISCLKVIIGNSLFFIIFIMTGGEAGLSYHSWYLSLDVQVF
jgi:hypothetical protein